MTEQGLLAGALRDEGFDVASCGAGMLLAAQEDSDHWYVVKGGRRGAAVEVVAYTGTLAGVVHKRIVLAAGCSESSAVAEVLAFERGV